MPLIGVTPEPDYTTRNLLQRVPLISLKQPLQSDLSSALIVTYHLSNITVVFVLLYLFGGCSSPETTDSPYATAPVTQWEPTHRVSSVSTHDTLNAEVVYAGPELGIPARLHHRPEYLVVGDATEDPALHILRTDGGTYVTGLGRAGQGPGEYGGVSGITSSNDTTVIVYDRDERRLTRYRYDPSRRPDSILTLVHTRPLNVQGHVLELAAVGPDTLVATGTFTAGRLAFLDTQGRELGTTGDVPPGTPSEPVSVRQHAYQSYLAYEPDRARIAVATRHADVLEIYDADGRRLHLSQGPADFDPVYDWRMRGDTPSMTSGRDLRFGYVGLTTSPDSIYALYSGMARADKPRGANLGASLRVFDWTGRLHSSYPLDSDVIAAEYVPAENAFYAVRFRPEPAVVRFSFPGPK